MPMSDKRDLPAATRYRDCTSEGARAADAGGAVTDDPYLPGTPEFAQWMEGWCNRTAIRRLARVGAFQEDRTA